MQVGLPEVRPEEEEGFRQRNPSLRPSGTPGFEALAESSKCPCEAEARTLLVARVTVDTALKHLQQPGGFAGWWPGAPLSTFLRNIPVQITKGQTCRRGSLSSQRQLGLWGVRPRGAGPAWPSGQKGKREGVELHIRSLERTLRGQGGWALPMKRPPSVLCLWAQVAGAPRVRAQQVEVCLR